MTYKHTQMGAWMLVFFAIAAALILFSQGGVMVNSSWIAFVILVPASLIFSSQTIIVDDALHWHFGFGFWRKKLSFDDISSVRQVRNKWYYGLGIRLTPHGWLYTVSGLDAVEIEKTDGSKIRLGSDEPDLLAHAIESKITPQPPAL